MKKRALLAIFAVFMFVLMAGGCGSNSASDSKTISMALSNEPSSLDPAITYGLSESDVELAIFEGLTRIDEKGVAQPALAEKWDVSADGLTYTFHLRKDLKWSDGTPITAKDFEYSWKRVLDPQLASGNAYMLFIIEGAEDYNSEKGSADKVGIKAVDDNTLQVKLAEPAAYFLDLTAFHAFYPVPKHAVEANKDGWAGNAETIVGNGPFKITKWAHSGEIILEKNENYWNPSVVASNTIKMPISESKSTRLTMLESNQTDLILDPPPADEDRLKEKGLYKVEPQIGTTYYVFNVTKAPFDKVEVRKAFAMAVSRTDMIEKVVKNGKKAAVTFIPPDILVNGKDFASESGSLVVEDAAQAKKLLAASGYNGEPVTILYNTNETNKAIAESIQAMWKSALGVNVELTNQETKVFYASRENGEYQVATANWIADFADPVNFLDVFTAKDNDAQYHNAEYNAIMKAVHKEVDPAKRAQLMHQAEKKLFDDCVIIPLYYTSQVIAVSPNLTGYYCSPMGVIDLIKAHK